MHITKTSIVLDDPVNNTNNPKRIPGATIRYCFTVDNNGTGVATDVKIHDTLNSTGNRDKLTYKDSGHGSLSTSTGPCSTGECKNITDTSGTYNNSTKKVTIDLADPFHANSYQCAYIDVEIK